MSTFVLEVVTPERLVYSNEVSNVNVRGVEGDLGIFAGHIPFVTQLQIHPVLIREDNKTQLLAISGGFVEVSKNKVVILAHSAEFAKEIDVERALASKERAQQRLSTNKKGTNLVRSEISLKRALNRINVYNNKQI